MQEDDGCIHKRLVWILNELLDLENNTALNGERQADEGLDYSSLGYVFQNHKTHKFEWGIERSLDGQSFYESVLELLLRFMAVLIWIGTTHYWINPIIMVFMIILKFLWTIANQVSSLF